jgi:hypothetical protein
MMNVILSEAKDLTRLQSAFYGDQFRINAPNSSNVVWKFCPVMRGPSLRSG